MGNLVYKSASGYNRGPVANETGMNLSSFKVVVTPEVREGLPDIEDQWRGFAVGDPMRAVTISGEFHSTLAGPMLATFTTAFVPTNDIDFFGADAGGLYLTSGSLNFDRGAWNSADLEFESHYNVA